MTVTLHVIYFKYYWYYAMCIIIIITIFSLLFQDVLIVTLYLSMHRNSY